MCITGCSPRRAGNNFFSSLKGNFSHIRKIAAERNIKTDVFRFPLRKYIKSFDTSFASAVRNSFKNGLNTPENFLYQGTLFFAEGDLRDNAFFKKHFWSILFGIKDKIGESLKTSPRFTYFDATSSGGDDFPKLTMVKAFSSKKNIKSYLCGDDSFRFPHWFVDKNVSDYENVDDTLRIVRLDSKSDAKGFYDNFSKKNNYTECVFCSEKIYKYARELIGNKFGYDMVLRVG